MKKIAFQPTFLQIIYLTIFIILFAFIIYTPTLITGSASITKKLIIEEETIEGILLGILFLLSIFIFNLYKRDVNRHQELIKKINNDKKRVEERLINADQYIGRINVQLQEINSIFSNISKYPETKNDLKNTFRFFGNRILSIVNSNWVLFRIINSITQRTIIELIETRQGFSFNCPHVSNKMIIEKQSIPPFTSVISKPENLNVLVFCIIPIENTSNEQQVFVQAILNEITKLFVIMNSTYDRKENEIRGKKTKVLNIV